MPPAPSPATAPQEPVRGMAGLLERAAARWPDSPAVSADGHTFSWARLHQRCRRLAAGLRRSGVAHGDRVAYLGFNSLANFELMYAPAMIGAILVPINFRLSTPEMLECLEDARPSLLVVDPQHGEQGRKLARACPGLGPVFHTGETVPRDMRPYADLFAAPPAGDMQAGADDDTLVLFYTGGTTGRAKGVMLSHANLLANARGTAPLYGMRDREVYLLASPMFHTAAGSRVYTAALMGAHTVILSRFDTGEVIRAIEKYRINCVQLVPTMIQMILDHPDLDRHDLSSLRMISYGAAPMPVALMQRTVTRFPDIRFFQSYGMTECSPVVSVLDDSDHELRGDYLTRLGSVGRPVPHVQVRVVDDTDRELPAGETGEILVRGPNVMHGYWQAPDLTARAMKNGWYHTGDGGYFNHDGYLVLAGRIKDMIVSGGENVYPIEIENRLSRHPAVRECAVIGVPHPKWGEAVHAVVRLNDGHRVSAEELIDYCRAHIARYKCPVGVTFRDEPMPLSALNKILKSELRKIFEE